MTEVVTLGTILKQNKSLRHFILSKPGVGSLAMKVVYSKIGLSRNFAKKNNNKLTESIRWFERYIKKQDDFKYLKKVLDDDMWEIYYGSINKRVRDGSYKGHRHINHLPLRGQRTHTNRRTQRELAAKRHWHVLNLFGKDREQSKFFDEK